jgi:SAM-dependent methyltransferase
MGVYATARGPLARLAEPWSERARARRHALFLELTGADEGTKIVDLGCGALGLRALAPGFDVTGVDHVERPEYPGPFVRADATARLPFADGEFDLAYCSSVVEHVDPRDRPALAREIMRVGRSWWVQTPAFSFPIEPHALLPFAHWLPPRPRRAYWRLGAAGDWEEVSLLRRREMEALFGGGRLVAERAGPLVKSWISVGRAGARA